MEKTLLVGFGIFTLIIFLSIIFPFFEKLEEAKGNNRDEEESDKKIQNFQQIEYNFNIFFENSNIIPKNNYFNRKKTDVFKFLCINQLYNFLLVLFIIFSLSYSIIKTDVICLN
ncbi:MAG TPA: hypothetical protein VGB37_10475 [Candidatus Lokiarchaeia archaeon]